MGTQALYERVRSLHSDSVDFTQRPRIAQRSKLNLGLVSTDDVCCFGDWRGAIRCDGTAVEIRDLIGWAEEFAYRW
jgi:hypothetical protein